jgi:hypothetical protein
MAKPNNLIKIRFRSFDPQYPEQHQQIHEASAVSHLGFIDVDNYGRDPLRFVFASAINRPTKL